MRAQSTKHKYNKITFKFQMSIGYDSSTKSCTSIIDYVTRKEIRHALEKIQLQIRSNTYMLEYHYIHAKIS